MIQSAALMLEISFGLKEEARRVTRAIDRVLKAGYRTPDIASATTERKKILGTKEMGSEVLNFLSKQGQQKGVAVH